MPHTPIYCNCGRPLEVEITREGVRMHCPAHGLRFRFKVDCSTPDLPPEIGYPVEPGAEAAPERKERRKRRPSS